MTTERTLGYWEALMMLGMEKIKSTVPKKMGCSGLVYQFAQVGGELPTSKLQEALLFMQERHPLLRARVVPTTTNYKFSFSTWNQDSKEEKIHKIPLRTTSLGRKHREFLSKKFEYADQKEIPPDGYRWKLIHYKRRLPRHKRRNACWNGLLLIVDHTISDAISTSNFLHELLSYCSGNFKGLEPDLPLLEAMERLIPREERKSTAKTEGLTQKQPDFLDQNFRFFSRFASRNLFYSVDKDHMSSLIAACKMFGIKVNSFLVAALLKALYSEADDIHTVPFATALNLRSFCKPEVTHEHFGCFVTVAHTQHDFHKDIDLIALAKAYEGKLREQIDDRAKDGFLPLEFDKRDLLKQVNQGMIDLSNIQKFTVGAAISNIGVLNYPKRYGKLFLNEMFFWTAQPSGHFPIALTVLTLHGKLQACFSYTTGVQTRERAEAIAQNVINEIKSLNV